MGPGVRRDDDVGTRLHVLAARCARVVARILRPREGVGNAGCPMHPQPRVRILAVSMHTSIHSEPPESPGIPARNGFNGFLRALLGDRLSCHRRLRNEFRQLERQRRGVRTTRLRRPPQALSSEAPSASTASRPAFVTTAKRPSDRDGIDGMLLLIWGRDQRRRLRQIGTTGKSPVHRSSLRCPQVTQTVGTSAVAADALAYRLNSIIAAPGGPVCLDPASGTTLTFQKVRWKSIARPRLSALRAGLTKASTIRLLGAYCNQ